MAGRRGASLALGAALALAAGATGCSTAATDPAATGSTTLDVYLGLPLQGPRAAESQAIAEGAKLALAQAGGRVGPFTVKLAVLDDSTSAAGGWDRDAAAGTARTALEDRTTVAYIGDSDAGATGTSLPLTNAAGILQVTARSTADGLTQGAEARDLRPSGRQTLARAVARDGAGQVAAIVGLEREAGCRRPLQVTDDGDPSVTTALQGWERLGDPGGLPFARLARFDPDCVVFAAGPTERTAALLDRLHRTVPDATIIGADGVGVPGVLGALDAGTQRALRVTVPAPASAPAFARAYEQAYGRAPLPIAVQGQVAMDVVLGALRRAGAQAGNRRAVIAAATGPGSGVDAAGDLAGQRWSVARVADGALTRLRAAARTCGEVGCRAVSPHVGSP